jgi:hypothetical protein
MFGHFLKNEFFQFFVLNKLLHIGFTNSQTFSGSQNSIRIRMNDGNIKVLQGVAIQEAFSDIWTSEVNVLDLFWGDVLSLTELVNILFSINDFQGAIGQNYSDVPTVVPAILIDGLFGVFFIQVVSLEY